MIIKTLRIEEQNISFLMEIVGKFVHINERAIGRGDTEPYMSGTATEVMESKKDFQKVETYLNKFLDDRKKELAMNFLRNNIKFPEDYK